MLTCYSRKLAGVSRSLHSDMASTNSRVGVTHYQMAASNTVSSCRDMPRMPAVKAVTPVQEVVETHLEARVPRGEAAEAILDSWHEQVTVAAQLR